MEEILKIISMRIDLIVWTFVLFDFLFVWSMIRLRSDLSQITKMLSQIRDELKKFPPRNSKFND